MLHDWRLMLLKQTFFTCHSLAKHDYISRASEAVFPLTLQKWPSHTRMKSERLREWKDDPWSGRRYLRTTF